MLAAVKAWFYTHPVYDNGVIAFGGMNITLGYLSAIVYFLIIYVNKNIVSVFLGLPYLYFTMFSGARTGYVVFIVCFFLLCLSLMSQKGTKLSFKRFLIPILIGCSVLVLFSLSKTKNRFFPYLLLNPIQEERNLLEDQQKQRKYRLGRFKQIFRTVLDLHKNESIPMESRRIILYRDTLSDIAKKWWGHWPSRFTFFDTFMNKNLRYPHNLILESGYYFGMVIMAITFFLMFGIMGRIVYAMYVYPSSIIAIWGIPAMGYMVAMQFTGTFYSYISFIIFPFFAICLKEEDHLSGHINDLH